MDEVERLIAELANPDGPSRMDAAYGLVELKDARTVPVLIGTLKNKDLDLRCLAAEGLEQIGIPAVPALVEALDDKDSDAWMETARILGIIARANPGNAEPADAVPALIVALKDENCDVRERALGALGNIVSANPGNAVVFGAAVHALCELLNDDDEDVRMNVESALYEIAYKCDNAGQAEHIHTAMDKTCAHSQEEGIENLRTYIQDKIASLNKAAVAQGKDGLMLVGEKPKAPEGGGNGVHQGVGKARAVRNG